MRLRITDPVGRWDVVLSCVSDAEVRDREGNSGRGFTNLKSVQYRPALIDGFLAQTGLTLEPEPP